MRYVVEYTAAVVIVGRWCLVMFESGFLCTQTFLEVSLHKECGSGKFPLTFSLAKRFFLFGHCPLMVSYFLFYSSID